MSLLRFKGMWHHKLRGHSQMMFWSVPVKAYVLLCSCGNRWIEPETGAVTE